jgi:excisionase family DNA binding protein
VSYDIEVLKKKELLLVAEAAEWLRCSRRSIYNLLEEGKLKAVRNRGPLRIIRTSIEKYIDSHLADPSI